MRTIALVRTWAIIGIVSKVCATLDGPMRKRRLLIAAGIFRQAARCRGQIVDDPVAPTRRTYVFVQINHCIGKPLVSRRYVTPFECGRSITSSAAGGVENMQHWN